MSINDSVERNKLEDSIISSFGNDYIQGSLREPNLSTDNYNSPYTTNTEWKRKSLREKHKNINVRKNCNNQGINIHFSFSEKKDRSKHKRNTWRSY